MSRTKSVIQNHVDQFLEHYRLIFPSALILPMQQKRIDIIQMRIRSLAWVLAIGIPACAPFDAIAFPQELWRPLLIARLLAGATFASFLLLSDAFLQKQTRRLGLIYLQLFIVFTIPTFFYFYSRGLPELLVELTPFGHAVVNSYRLLPFAVLACVGLFPLTLLESFSIVVLVLMVYSEMTAHAVHVWGAPELGMEWIMLLLAAIAIVVSYSQLRMLIMLIGYSSYDMLTDCLGRRSGEEVLGILRHYSIRKKTHFSLAIIDLDYFKQVNDRFGHHQGDAILAVVAKKIKASLRKSDFVIRWGGDEFLVVLPDADIESATAVLCRMAETGFGLRPDGSAQSVSMGIAERIIDNTDDVEYLLQMADKRLYQAKIGGRNRAVGTQTILFSPPLLVKKKAQLLGENGQFPEDPLWSVDEDKP